MTEDEHLDEIVARLRDARRIGDGAPALDEPAARTDIAAALRYFRGHRPADALTKEERRTQRAAYRKLAARLREAEAGFEAIFDASLERPLLQAWRQAAGEGTSGEEARRAAS